MAARLLLIPCFAAVLLLPLLQHAGGWLPDAALVENRRPAPAPRWGDGGLRGYLLGWQAWFNDRYAGRSFLIRLHGQVEYSLWRHSDRVHIGRDGWLFYRSVIDVQEPALERMTDAEHDRIIANVRRFRERLAARGITLLVLDVEMKGTFYPEMLPGHLPRRTTDGRHARLRERLARETGAEYLDTTSLLRALKRERPIFHRTDFHWNDPAAFAVAGAVVDRLAALAGPGHAGWRWPLEIERKSFSGGEAAFLPLLAPLEEDGLFVRKTWPDLPRSYVANDGPFEFTVIHTHEDPTLLPGVVVFGDSFFDGLIRSGFVEHFRAVHRARIHHATLADTLAAVPAGTRFFILQFISTATPVLAAPLPAEPVPAGPAGGPPDAPPAGGFFVSHDPPRSLKPQGSMRPAGRGQPPPDIP